MSDKPVFHVQRTLLAFGEGEIDMNRIVLVFPDGEEFVLYQMGEPRGDKAADRCNLLAQALNRYLKRTKP